jgi:hypothetical protein
MAVGIIPTPPKTTARAKRPTKLGLPHNWCAHRSPALPPADAVFLAARYRSGRTLSECTTKTSSAGATASLTRQENGGLRAPLSLRATGGRELRVGAKRAGYHSALKKGVCSGSYPNRTYIDCRIIPAKPIPTDFKKRVGRNSSPCGELPTPGRRNVSQMTLRPLQPGCLSSSGWSLPSCGSRTGSQGVCSSDRRK